MRRVDEETFYAAVVASADEARWSRGYADRCVYVSTLLEGGHCVAKVVTTFDRQPTHGVGCGAEIESVEYFVCGD